jgi:hypothetical protein
MTSSSPTTDPPERIFLVAGRDWSSWTQLLKANVWTAYGIPMSFNFGFGLFLRLFPLHQAGDYVGFWGWFLLIALAGAGYGIFRARQDAAAGVAPRPISRAENVLAGVLAVVVIVTIFATDNTSARMPGRYFVALLVAMLIVADAVSRRWRRRATRTA